MSRIVNTRPKKPMAPNIRHKSARKKEQNTPGVFAYAMMIAFNWLTLYSDVKRARGYIKANGLWREKKKAEAANERVATGQ